MPQLALQCRPRNAAAATSLSILVLFAGSAPSSAVGVFSSLAGSWRGDGSIQWTSGETERIRCQGVYTVDAAGNEIKQHLTCASDATKLIIDSTLAYKPDADVITGSWNESSYHVGGWVTGTANPTTINALVQSNDKKFSSRISVVTQGEEQTVSIKPQGLDVSEVSVTLRRGG